MNRTTTLNTPLPPIFVSHGSPMTALEPGAAGAFMQRLGPAIDATFGRPKAVLAISGHMLTRQPVLLAAARHEAVYDFGGFDPKLRTLRYDVPGAPALAERALGLLAAAGIQAQVVSEGGLDHGTWTPLRYLYPDADIPVLPLAWVPTDSPESQQWLGQALAPLTHEGVLVMGSGSITHNLSLFMQGRPAIDAPEYPASQTFRDWWADAAAKQDWAALHNYRQQAPHAVAMHPSDEHLLPWFVAAGAGAGSGDHDAAPVRLHAGAAYAYIGMDAYAFGPQAQALAQALRLT
jgi:4,5-DOPA dioxygenase extradiol